MWKAERALSNRTGVASPRPPPATWSITACPTYRGGMEIRAAAENVLPVRGHGGKRLSFLLRLRRRLGLGVTSQRGLALALTEHGKKPPAEPDTKPPAEPDKKRRGLKLIRFLRSRLARASRPPLRSAAQEATAAVTAPRRRCQFGSSHSGGPLSLEESFGDAAGDDDGALLRRRVRRLRGFHLGASPHGRIHDTQCELHIMEMFLCEEIPPVLGASSL